MEDIRATLSKWRRDTIMFFHFYFEKTNQHPVYRWIGSFVLSIVYALRVFYVQRFYFVTYVLAIYMSNLLIDFLSPRIDPKLPTKGSEEFKPLIHRLSEFKFWYSCTTAFFLAFCLTFFPTFDIPASWPVLLFFWSVLFGLTKKRQIMHMIKHKFNPFRFWKQVIILAIDEKFNDFINFVFLLTRDITERNLNGRLGVALEGTEGFKDQPTKKNMNIH